MNKWHSSVDSAVLKQLLPTYLERIGQEPVMRPSGVDLTAHCPLHADRKPSLTAKKKENDWEWFCHPCNVGGTIIELHAKRRKLDPKTQFQVICKEVAEILDGAVIIDQGTTEPNKTTPALFSKDELTALSLQWRTRLNDDAGLREKFACELGLRSDILQWAAKYTPDGLGITPAGYKCRTPAGTEISLREPRLVYVGDGYFKIRAPFGNEAEPRFWMSGQQSRPWLGQMLVPGDPTIKDVHVHESETSALALIAAGFWSSDNSSIVVATSGCGGFKQEWRSLFAGRAVHFWPDADEAGMKFANETAGVLHGAASQIIFHDWHPKSTTSKP